MKVLLVEDHVELANAIAQILRKNGCSTDSCQDGESGLDCARSGIYDVIVLDWMLPAKSGADVLKALRADGISTPVLMLTAKDELDDKREAFGLGADDYLTKPFSVEELLLRLIALSRRPAALQLDHPHFGNTSLQIQDMTLCTSTQSILLSLKECNLMEMLLRANGTVVAKERMIEKVWGFDSDAEHNCVEAYISFLRKKLKAISSDVEIHAIRGVGYCLRTLP